jgi:hypothetical protein
MKEKTMKMTRNESQESLARMAADHRVGGYETDASDARRLARWLRDSGYRVRVHRTAAHGRRLLTWVR